MEDTLSIDDIVLNLKMISKIKQNDKLVVINKILNVDCRVALPLRRWYTTSKICSLSIVIGSWGKIYSV